MNILEKIVAQKKLEIERSRSAFSDSQVEGFAQIAPRPVRNFFGALANDPHQVALIAEIKRGSPSKGTIRSELDACAVAVEYESAGAACLSVLTDATFFQAVDEDFLDARLSTQLPVLRKDFIIDHRQVFESRMQGADAILLIARLLTDHQLREFRDTAESLEMGVLVEAHTLEEAERAIDCGAKIVGVNNRDLDTFETRLELSEQVIPIICDRVLAVSESAIETNADIERVRQAGARAVLIGTTFMASASINQKVNEVMGW